MRDLVDGWRLVSNSEIQAFKSCRRRWWLAWYRGYTPRLAEVEGVRSTGTRLHVALAAYYTSGKRSVSAAMTGLDKAQGEDMSLISEGTDVAKLLKDFELERIMLEGYFQWLAVTGEDVNLEVVSSEEYLEAEFLDGSVSKGRAPVKIIGKLDTRVIDIRNGERKFLDHKTVVSFENPMLLGINEQTLHYQLLEWLTREEGEAYCTAALYNMLRRVRRTANAVPPFYQRISIERNRHELDSYRYRLTGAITDMQAVEHQLQMNDGDPLITQALVYPTPTRDCVWKCEFFKICRLFDDGSRAEAALEGQYEQHDPLEYYQGKEREE